MCTLHKANGAFSEPYACCTEPMGSLHSLVHTALQRLPVLCTLQGANNDPSWCTLQGTARRHKPHMGLGVHVGSAYLSARRTFGRRMYSLIRQPHPPLATTCLWTASAPLPLARFTRHGGQPPHPPKITRLLRWPQTAFCVHRLVCAPHCVCTALRVHCHPSPPPPLRLASLDTGASPRTPLE